MAEDASYKVTQITFQGRRVPIMLQARVGVACGGGGKGACDPSTAVPRPTDAAPGSTALPCPPLHSTCAAQDVNGPCPLLAIANVLLLRGQLQLPAAGGVGEVTQVGPRAGLAAVVCL